MIFSCFSYHPNLTLEYQLLSFYNILPFPAVAFLKYYLNITLISKYVARRNQNQTCRAKVWNKYHIKCRRFILLVQILTPVPVTNPQSHYYVTFTSAENRDFCERCVLSAINREVKTVGYVLAGCTTRERVRPTRGDNDACDSFHEKPRKTRKPVVHMSINC